MVRLYIKTDNRCEAYGRSHSSSDKGLRRRVNLYIDDLKKYSSVE